MLEREKVVKGIRLFKFLTFLATKSQIFDFSRREKSKFWLFEARKVKILSIHAVKAQIFDSS